MLPLFKTKVIEIIAKLPSRSFSLLRAEVINALEEFHQDQQASKNKSFSRNICSKHWWFNFLDRNPDIKLMWMNVRISRSNNKINNLRTLFEEAKHPDVLSEDDLLQSRSKSQSFMIQKDALSAQSNLKSFQDENQFFREENILASQKTIFESCESFGYNNNNYHHAGSIFEVMSPSSFSKRFINFPVESEEEFNYNNENLDKPFYNFQHFELINEDHASPPSNPSMLLFQKYNQDDFDNNCLNKPRSCCLPSSFQKISSNEFTWINN